MGKEQTSKKTSELLPRWKEIREYSEDKKEETERLELTISEYLKILEFGKNIEEESGGAAPEETNGEWRNPNRTV
ncbi:MAG TPA: hypothetical protein VKV17_20740 [Bryobacteraceae bacterium]|nr:hypothetical protein [Bryobacteraceae bacterium]